MHWNYIRQQSIIIKWRWVRAVCLLCFLCNCFIVSYPCKLRFDHSISLIRCGQRCSAMPKVFKINEWLITKESVSQYVNLFCWIDLILLILLNILSNDVRKTVRYGWETILNRSPFLWANLPWEYKSQKSLSAFKRKIRQWNGEICVCRRCKVYKPNISFI